MTPVSNTYGKSRVRVMRVHRDGARNEVREPTVEAMLEDHPPDTADYPAANVLVLRTLLTVFGTTYSRGIQDSLFRMGEAVLAAVPEVDTVSMACPNKRYIPVDLGRFGLAADNCVFVCTDEPHGPIERTVSR